MTSLAYHSGTKMSFPGFDRVYELRDPGTPEFRTTVGASIDEARAVTRGEITPLEPVKLQWVMGRRNPRDFIWTGLAVPRIVHERIVAILSKHGFLGWSLYPVEVYGPKGERVNDYHGLAIGGRCGALRPDRSEEIQKVGPAGTWITVYRGLYCDESAWDGSDLFMPSDQLAGMVFVTQPVRDVLLRAKVKGAAFDRLDSTERSFL
jgi:hypothetical protein